MTLSHETMGCLALSVLWVTTLLVVWVGVRDAWHLTRRLMRMRGHVHRAKADTAIATHVAEQVGRAQSASGTRRAIFFRDRGYKSVFHGGTLRFADGHAVALLEAPGILEVWLEKPKQPPEAGEFANAYAQALKPRGLPVTLSREARGELWLAAQRCGDTLRPLADGTWLVSTFDPRHFCRSAILSSAAVLLAIVAWSAAVTALVLHAPVFGAVSTFGGVLGLAEFLLIQPLGTWLRDRVLWPHEAPVETRWLEAATSAPASPRGSRSAREGVGH